MLSFTDKAPFTGAVLVSGGRETVAVSLVQGSLAQATSAAWSVPPTTELAVFKGGMPCAEASVAFSRKLVDVLSVTGAIDRSLATGLYALLLCRLLLRSAVSLWPVQTYGMHHPFNNHDSDLSAHARMHARTSSPQC